jgi:hypothetical protein
LCRGRKHGNFTPDELLEAVEVPFVEGTSEVVAEFRTVLDRTGYCFVKLCEDPSVRVRVSDERLTGVLALSNAFNKAVATSSEQRPPEGIGIDAFEFWLPKRRPEGRNLAMKIDPPIALFGAENTATGPARPTGSVNAWVADPADREPELRLEWDEAVPIGRVVVEFDPDWDHPMESVLMTHPEEVAPFMARDFDLLDANGRVLATARDHHGARFVWTPDAPVETSGLVLKIRATHGTPAAVFRMRVYGGVGD